MKGILYIAFFILPLFSLAQTDAKPVPSEKAKQAAKDKLEGYRQRVLKGESMSVLATLYTEDPGSAKTGGRYDNISRGMFVPEFEEVAFKLAPGEVSEIFETTYGFHFIQLIERRGDVVDVRHILVVPREETK
jgi:peptidyl-prolyl cis-trans isomerase SurA